MKASIWAYIFLLGIGVSWLSSCEEDQNVTLDFTEAVVGNLGDPALDGCGWVVTIDQTDFKPSYLPQAYEQDGLEVLVQVEYLNSTTACGLNPDALREIRIVQIKPR